MKEIISCRSVKIYVHVKLQINNFTRVFGKKKLHAQPKKPTCLDMNWSLPYHFLFNLAIDDLHPFSEDESAVPIRLYYYSFLFSDRVYLALQGLMELMEYQ